MPSSFLTMRYFLPASSALRTNVSVSRFVGAVVHPMIFEGCLLVPSFSAIVAAFSRRELPYADGKLRVLSRIRQTNLNVTKAALDDS